ncbi:phosphatase PAP2 family protein [Halomonas sp. M20]|uniref:phosphatase PAP2 family protein n=1 Tax=Halomonas sp. M20 TaxID=2763264 RepID=UPI001D0A2A5F|nr:phosphatase PAP2 family protein [Halomonas sp. M20]
MYRLLEKSRQSSHHPFTFLTWLGRYEFSILLSAVVLFAGIWGFIELADTVMEGETRSLDERILLAFRTPGDLTDPLGPGWIEELGRDFTALGGVGVLVFITLITFGYLLLSRYYRASMFLLASVGGGLLASTLLKLLFDRPRPDLVSHGSIVYTASFPSGHSMMAAVTYLTLAALLIRIQPRWRLKAYLLLAALLVTVLVGISRVYMGVHWPTDVLAGWTAGAVWASLCWLVARWLQQRGAVETSVQGDEE